MIEEGSWTVGQGIHPFFPLSFFSIPQVEKETREEMKVYGKPDNLSLAQDWADGGGGGEREEPDCQTSLEHIFRNNITKTLKFKYMGHKLSSRVRESHK